MSNVINSAMVFLVKCVDCINGATPYHVIVDVFNSHNERCRYCKSYNVRYKLWA
jgi:hypothetical protein